MAQEFILSDRLKSELNIDNIKRSVFARLTAASEQTLDVSDTYQPITGTFSNVPINNFEMTSEPSIKYLDSETKQFEIDIHSSIRINAVGKNVYLSVYKKVSGGSFVLVEEMDTYLKFNGEPQPISLSTVIELAQYDEIQLLWKTEDAGDKVTFNHLQTTINMFNIN